MKYIIMCNIIKVCPDVSELSSVNTNLKCTEKDCNVVLKSGSNLKMHYLKHHLKTPLTRKKLPNDSVIQYHCPEESCIYNTSSTKFFSQKRLLKQHYLKVHAAKLYNCTKCSKAFSTIAQKNSHIKVCGEIFKCSDCNWEYSSIEALLTHCRRKNHKKSSINNNLNKDNSLQMPIVAENIILLNLNQALFTNTQNKEVQTDFQEKNLKFHSKVRKRNTQQTQTLVYKSKKIKNNVETQTIKHSIIEKAMYNANLYISKSNAQTQSEDQRNLKQISQNTPSKLGPDHNMDINYFELSPYTQHVKDDNIENEEKKDNVLVDNLLSETIVNNNSHNLCSIETQTERFDLSLNENMDSSFTQTTDLSLDHLLYSNMCTQTCDDILLSELGFNNSHTQTYWPGYEDSVSAETQTTLTDLLLGDRSTQTNNILSDNLLEQAEFTQSYANTSHGS